MPGIADANSKPPEPGLTGTVEAHRVRRAPTGDERLALDPNRCELAGEPEDERVDAPSAASTFEPSPIVSTATPSR